MPLSNGFSSGIDTLTLSPLGKLERLGHLWKMSTLARKREHGWQQRSCKSYLPRSDLRLLVDACETPQVPSRRNVVKCSHEHTTGALSLERSISLRTKSPTFRPKNIASVLQRPLSCGWKSYRTAKSRANSLQKGSCHSIDTHATWPPLLEKHKRSILNY